MGNRAIVIFTCENHIAPAVYLHWNGGPESIYAFLAEHSRRHNRTNDPEYAAARFCHLVGDFFDQDETSITSLGILNAPKSLEFKDLAKMEPEDNGIYLVSPTHANPDDPRAWTDCNLTIRRFLGWEHFREMTSKEVATERAQAIAHPSFAAIATTFARIRPKIGQD